MNQQIATVPSHGITRAWSGSQLDIIRRTVAADTNDTEFDLFIEYAKVKGLDPFSRQVIAIVFSKDKPDKRRMSIVTTQDGCRVLAQRCGDYRPAEDEPVFTYGAEKTPINPLGIEKCTVTLWKQDKQGEWHKVNGTAYWSEFSPVKTDDRVFEWVATGDTWPNGKPKNRRQLKEGVKIEDHQTLDDSGNWKKMPRLMIAKCATMQALRAGWPETFSGVYGEEEFDKSVAMDRTASEMVEMEQTSQRQKRVAMLGDEYALVDDNGDLKYVASGNFAELVLNMAHGYKTADQVESMEIRNREGMKRFWANHKSDALEMRKQLDARKDKLRSEKVAEPA